jgi:hypothetical protein
MCPSLDELRKALFRRADEAWAISKTKHGGFNYWLRENVGQDSDLSYNLETIMKTKETESKKKRDLSQIHALSRDNKNT